MTKLNTFCHFAGPPLFGFCALTPDCCRGWFVERMLRLDITHYGQGGGAILKVDEVTQCPHRTQCCIGCQTEKSSNTPMESKWY